MSKFEVKSTLGRDANATWEVGDVVSAAEIGAENIGRLVELGVIALLEEPSTESTPKKRGGKS